MSKNTSVYLGIHFDSFIESQLTDGRYRNASEIIRAGLRILEDEESKLIALRIAVKEGIDSGIAKDFNAENHLQKLKKNKVING